MTCLQNVSITLCFCIFVCVCVCQDEELRRKKREEHLEMIRNNSQLKSALKRKVEHNILIPSRVYLYTVTA